MGKITPNNNCKNDSEHKKLERTTDDKACCVTQVFLSHGCYHPKENPQLFKNQRLESSWKEGLPREKSNSLPSKIYIGKIDKI